MQFAIFEKFFFFELYRTYTIPVLCPGMLKVSDLLINMKYSLDHTCGSHLEHEQDQNLQRNKMSSLSRTTSDGRNSLYKVIMSNI